MLKYSRDMPGQDICVFPTTSIRHACAGATSNGHTMHGHWPSPNVCHSCTCARNFRGGTTSEATAMRMTEKGEDRSQVSHAHVRLGLRLTQIILITLWLLGLRAGGRRKIPKRSIWSPWFIFYLDATDTYRYIAQITASLQLYEMLFLGPSRNIEVRKRTRSQLYKRKVCRSVNCTSWPQLLQLQLSPQMLMDRNLRLGNCIRNLSHLLSCQIISIKLQFDNMTYWWNQLHFKWNMPLNYWLLPLFMLTRW